MRQNQRANSAISFLNRLRGKGLVTYQINEVGGDSNHGPFTFICVITYEGKNVKGRGTADDKRTARQLAAADALEKLKAKVSKDVLDDVLKEIGWTSRLSRKGEGYVLRIICENAHRDFEAPTASAAIEKAIENFAMAAIGAVVLMDFVAIKMLNDL